ncbi:MAG TPA: LapA family protein [bacterium]|nr:LapA family protein [bacterium]
MWIFRWLLIAVVMLLILGFALQNQEQTVSVNILNYSTPNLPLYLILYIAFGAGLLLWVAVSMVHVLKLKGEIHRIQKENKKIREELNRMRNMGVVEDENTPDIDEAPPVPGN